MSKLLTIDVWDTLLRRDCHPESIKLATAAYVFLLPNRIVSFSYKSHWDIYEARVQIENQLADSAEAEGFDREYEIVNVFSEWLMKICDKPYPDGLALALAEYELLLEIERTHVDPEIIAFLSKISSETTIFLSDFYMNSKMLLRLLEAKGLDKSLAGGISSCDYKLNKRSGKLFMLVHEKFGISPSEHVHAGDNQWSDVECPASLGVNSLLFKPAQQHEKREYLESLFPSRSILFKEIVREISRVEPKNSYVANPEALKSFRLGLMMAPMFIGFIWNVAEKSITDGVDKICYLTREGEFLKKIHDQLFAGREKFFGHNVPSSELLEVSRLSTFLPSLTSFSSDDFARMWRIHGQQSIKGFFATLGLNIDNFQKLLDICKIKHDEIIVSPEADVRFLQLIQSQQFLSAVEDRASDQKRLLTKYLRQKNIFDQMRIGVVDVGWRGSIQDNLAINFKNNEFFGYYLGLKKFIEDQPRNVKKSAWLINESDNFNDKKAKCLETYALIELLCNSNSGTILNYSWIANGVHARKHVDHLENHAFDHFTKHFQDGVIAAVPAFHDFINKYAVMPSEIRDVALNIWYKASMSPQEELVDVFMNSSQSDIFAFGDVFDRSNIPSLSVIIKAFFLKKHRKSLIKFIGRIQWTAAIKKMDGISGLHRNLLILIFSAANFYRRFKVKLRVR